MSITYFIFIISVVIISTKSIDQYRLSKTVIPILYQLKIKTYLTDDNFRFEGDVNIHLRLLAKANAIILHVKDLEVKRTQIELRKLKVFHDDEGGQYEVVTKCIQLVELLPKYDFLVINLSDECEQDFMTEYLLSISFAGKLKDNLVGYYRSGYIDRTKGAMRWLAVTQFEPDGARRAFPCFDEPDKKAKFQIQLGHHKNYTALSNMPIKKVITMKDCVDWRWSIFKESPPMATYFVAFTIHQMGYMESQAELRINDIPFRIWLRSDDLNQVEYAADIGPRILNFFEQLFDTEYPLEKMDVIGVPDFAAAAMENWGLIVFKDSALMYDEEMSPVTVQHRVALVIAHELAHQWFGNLVTMRWWSDIWLNEGFATYFSYLGVSFLEPQWHSLNMATLIESAWDTFQTDAFHSSHPVSVEISRPTDVAGIFDQISYSKAACIIRMMNHFLGNRIFFHGLASYLQDYSYSNAEQDNLWESLTAAAKNQHIIPSSVCLKDIMDSWTLQLGYPVIHVKRDCRRGSTIVTQERFLLNHRSKRKSFEQCWWIPLTITTEKELDFCPNIPQAWLECDTTTGRQQVMSLKLGAIASPDEWIIFNIQLTGFYRVNYDTNNWNLLIAYLNGNYFNRIHPVNRGQLIDDAFNLAWTGDLNYKLLISLLRYLPSNERDYLPWRAAIDNLGNLYKILSRTKHYGTMEVFFSQLLGPMYKSIGGITAHPETLEQVKMHTLITTWACEFEVDDCVMQSLKCFYDWKSLINLGRSTNAMPLASRSTILCMAMRHGTMEDWEFLWQCYLNSDLPNEQLTILKALACSRNLQALRKYLDLCFCTDRRLIKMSNVFTIFMSILSNDVGFCLAKEYFLRNIERIYAFFERDSTKMDKLLLPLSKRLYSWKEYNEIKSLTNKYWPLFIKSRLGIRRALETIKVNKLWLRDLSGSFIEAALDF